MKMTSFRDDVSATRCANDVSAIDFSEKQKNGGVTKSTSSNNVTITPTSVDEKNTSSNEKNQKQNDKSLHDSHDDDDEARAFKSQFDEIKCASRMLEYSKYNRFQGPAGRVPSAPLQKRTCETGLNSFHQRSHSHSTYPQQTNRQMLKHQRSISSIQGLSFNGNSSAFKFHGLPSTPFTSYGFDNPLHYFDDSSSFNGNDDAFMKFRDTENGGGRFGFNNNRFGSNADEWDDSSSGYLSPGYPSTPLSNGPFTPLTPPSTYSPSTPYLSPSTPYFAQPHSLLDDDELLEKAKRLEEERLLLQIQQRKLDDAIAAHKLRYHHSDPSLSETEARCKSNNTTPPLVPTRGKAISQMKTAFGNKLTMPMPLSRFQNFQEPIGTPIRKPEHMTSSSTTPTGNSNSSLSISAPTFSLFSNPPALSLNHNLLNQQQKYSHNGKFSGYPLTPSSSPPKTNDEGYFGSYKSVNNNIWNNNENSCNHNSAPMTMQTSSGFYFRAPLYSSPVDEREEDSLFTDEYFNLNKKKDYENNFTNYSLATSHWVD